MNEQTVAKAEGRERHVLREIGPQKHVSAALRISQAGWSRKVNGARSAEYVRFRRWFRSIVEHDRLRGQVMLADLMDVAVEAESERVGSAEEAWAMVDDRWLEETEEQWRADDTEIRLRQMQGRPNAEVLEATERADLAGLRHLTAKIRHMVAVRALRKLLEADR